MERQIFSLDPVKIKINDEIPRLREELGEIEELAESIREYGQLQPIIINRNMELIAGGRRLAACLIAGIDIQVCFNDAIEPTLMREMEIEENIRRKQFTPAEEVQGVAELHKLRQLKHGTANRGPLNTGWTEKQTAALLGKTQGAINQDLALAAAIEKFPSLSECKTKSEMRKTVKSFEKVVRRVEALKEYEIKIAASANKIKVPRLELADAFDHMKGIASNSIDLLLTDPPYGINIDKLSIGLGHKTGNVGVAGFQYKDDAIYSMDLLTELAKESHRFCKHTAHAYVFIAISNFHKVFDIFIKAGWIPNVRPIIWTKNLNNGQSNYPDYWPVNTYEAILFARKVDSRLIVRGRGDFIPCSPVLPSQKIHEAEKPVQLLKELISRCCLPSSILYDPFMGSGAAIEAALEMKLFAIGCDILKESYNATCERISKYIETKKEV